MEVKGAIYGLKESSRLFQLEMVKVCKAAGFIQLNSSPMTFIATDPHDLNLKSVASVVVDDVRNLDNCPALTLRLQDAIAARFEEITKDDCAVFAGIEQTATFVNGVNRVAHSQNKFITRTARGIGIVSMPPVSDLTMKDFYQSSVTPEDCIPADQLRYQRIIGLLIHALKTRHEIRPFVSYLSSKLTTPNLGDEAKALYVLRR